MKAIAILAFGALAGCCGRSACRPPCAPTARATALPPAPALASPGRVDSARPQVLLESTFFRASAGILDAALGASAGAGSKTLSGAQADAMLAGWKDAAVDVLAAPSIVTTQGDEATVVVGEAATGVEVDGRDPLATASWSGLAVWMRPLPSGASLDLDVRAAWREAPGRPAGVVGTRREVPAGHVLVLWGERVASAGGSSRVAAIVRPTPLPEGS